MANFTAQQAAACTFTRCESFKTDGVHEYWIISIVDENGCNYEWEDNTIPGNANVTAIKAASKAMILEMEMKTPSPIRSIESLTDIIGNVIG